MEVGRFVGRTEPLALLDDTIRLAAAGRPRFVVVGGEAGIGKTRLLHHVAQRAARAGTRVLSGSCIELGTEGLPLAPVTAVLRSLVLDPGPAALRSTLPGIDGLLRLLPELDPDQRGPDPQPRLFELFAALLRQLGVERPVLLVVDDLQWADRSTRDLLAVLVGTLRQGRVMVLSAYRTDDLGRRHPLRPLIARMERFDDVDRLELERLTRAETAELVEGQLGAAADLAVVDHVYRRSGGNPLFAEELAVSVSRDPGLAMDALPEFLQELLLVRFDALGEPARRVVRLAAVAGDRAAHALLAATTGPVPAPGLIAAISEAIDARVLTPDGDGYMFRHRLVRDAVLDDLLPAEQAVLHRACAEALQADPSLVAPDRYAAATARHWHGAGEPAMALPATLRAADAAAKVFAHAERAQLLERALGLWSRVPEAESLAGTTRLGLFEAAVAAATWAGESLYALRLLDAALAEGDRSQKPDRIAMLLAQRGMVLHTLDRDGAITTLDEALALVSTGRTRVRARVLDLAGAVFSLRGVPERARQAATEAAGIAAGLDDVELETNALTTLGQALAGLGEHDEALAALHTAHELAARGADAIRLVRVRLNLAETLHELGRSEEMIRHAQAGLATAPGSGLGRTLGALVAARLAAELAEVGRWDEAAVVCGRALEHDPPGAAGSALHAVLAEIALDRGERGLVREHLTRARALQRDPSSTGSPLGRLEAALALQENRHEDAGRLVLAEIGSGTAGWPLLVTGGAVVSSARLRGGALPRSGVVGASGELVTALRAAADRLPADTPLRAAYAGRLAAELGDPGASWGAVASSWRALGRPHATVHALLRTVEDREATDRPAARVLLRTAAAEAGRLGGEPLAEAIRTAALAAGVSIEDAASPDRPPDAIDELGLTEREVEVFRLLAAGRSNRQVADELFISVKTASVHVSNILAKLGVTSRGEAAALAHRMRLFEDEPRVAR